MKTQRSIWCFLCLLAVATAFAVPARRDVFTHTQKDGTVLTLTLTGDEYMHYYVDVNSGAHMQMLPDGDFALIADKTFAEMADRAASRRAVANERRLARLPRMRANNASSDRRKVGSVNTMSGTKKGLVILVNFKNLSFKSANNQTAFNNQFNQQGYNKNSHIGSVKDYFTAQSYGNFTIDFDVVGPVTVSQNYAYYGGNNSSGDDTHPAEMIIEALHLADNLGVDFSQYSWSNNGEVDQVFIIYAGYNEAQGAASNTIWPHEWNLSSAAYFGDGEGAQVIDGVTIDTYACTSELSGTTGSTMDGIGTACHEFSHCLGYPDLYDTNSGSAWGMDAYDLMDYGSYSGPNKRGEVPCGYSAYERWMAGWLTPIELSSPCNVTDMPALNDQPVAYIIYNDRNSNEYFLLENRQNRGWFNYVRNYSTAHGMLMTHVNYNATAWSQNKVNINSTSQRYTYVAADRSYTGSTLPADLFPGPGTTKYRTINDATYSNYGLKLFNNNLAGNTSLGKPITEITETNGLISFKFDGGAQDDGTRYTITYNDRGTTTTWTQTSYGQATVLPTPSGSYADWYTAGWSTVDITTPTALDNITLLDEGSSYLPNGNVTLYAVYINDDFLCTSHPDDVDYTITTVVNGVSTTWTQGSERIYTLPTPADASSEWTFAGWATSAVSLTTTAPTLVPGGTQILPTADITYYAVYRKTESGTATARFHLATSLTADKKYVLASSNTVGNTYALDASKASTTAAAAIDAVATTIVNDGDMAIASAPDTQIWTVSGGTSGKWQLKNDEYYLCVNGSGFTLKTSSSDLYWSTDNGLYGKSGSGSTSYYVYLDGTQLKTRTSNTATTGRLYLYEDGGVATTVYYSSTPIDPAYTVTFNAGAGTCGTSSFTQTQQTRSIALPTATATVSGWTFAGWAEASVSDATTAPEMLTAGTDYTPTADITLYAVYTALSYNGAVPTAHYATNPKALPASTFYHIYYDVCGTVETWTQSPAQPTATLPTAASGSERWTFVGWSTVAVAQTQEAPAVYEVGVTMTPTADVELFAVFFNGKSYISDIASYVPWGGTQDPALFYPFVARVGRPFASPHLDTDSEGQLTYTSSNPDVAEVDPETGVVTTKAPGVAIITVEQSATARHNAGSARYAIKVIE